MKNILKIDSSVGIHKDLIPFISTNLKISGCALVRLEPSEKLESDLLVVAALAGQILGDNFGYHTLNSADSNEILAVHTEGISNPDGIIPYFALGCIQPSESGGETRVFDGRIAASIIDAVPELTDVLIEYSALANPNSRVKYPLVISEHGRTVRYRSKVETNTVIQSGQLTEDQMYRRVDEIIHQSMLMSHSWQAGDLLFVNNLFTLHDRLPFRGYRKMLRVRYNDSLNPRVRY